VRFDRDGLFMADDWTMEAQDDPRFIKGIDEFNQGLFFECHETLEEIWLEDHGEDRKFYQAIIQIAAGYFKLEQGVPAGAIKLWRTGLEKLEPYGPVFLGVNVEALRSAVTDQLARLEADPQLTIDALTPPTILLIC
jgi:predicted metal-dependent hydrolase